MNLNPQNPATLSALAFVHHLSGNLAHALQLYHDASFAKSDDHCVNELIHRAVFDSQLVAPEMLYPTPGDSEAGPSLGSALDEDDDDQMQVEGRRPSGLARSIYDKPSPFNYH